MPQPEPNDDAPAPAPESWSYGLFIPHDPRAVGVVRATLRSVLRAARLNCLVDTAELLVSEVVTNAYRNSRADVYVAMDWTPPGEFEVSVYDSGGGSPAWAITAGGGGELREGGRGLTLVEACSDAWGVRDCSDPGAGVAGKAVWFRMAAKPGPG